MEFNQKLQELRKQKNLTQEELAEQLFVSRTAISKWESGRGYPNLDSLKAIAKFFNVTIDELLSGEELLTVSEEDNKQKQQHLRDIIFSLLDIGALLLVFLPFFGQKENGIIESVSLLSLTGSASYLTISYYFIVFIFVTYGILTLIFQTCEKAFWVNNKSKISLILSIIGTFLFIISRQPYAAAFLLMFLIIKVSMLIKQQ